MNGLSRKAERNTIANLAEWRTESNYFVLELFGKHGERKIGLFWNYFQVLKRKNEAISKLPFNSTFCCGARTQDFSHIDGTKQGLENLSS